MRARSPTNVEHCGRRASGMALDQFPNAHPLEDERALLESVFLGCPMVVLGNGGVEFRQ
jgi:hypothetical protein